MIKTRKKKIKMLMLKLLKPMYPAAVNSMETFLTANVSETDTVISVHNADILPDPDNRLVIGGTLSNAETVLLVSKTANTITVERGLEGIAQEWSQGTTIARNFTAGDHDAFKANIETNDENIHALKSVLENHMGDEPNQHSIKAITGLEETLSDINTSIYTLPITQDNIFHNGYFKNPVEQRGRTILISPPAVTSPVHFPDRWRVYRGGSSSLDNTVTLTPNGLEINHAVLAPNECFVNQIIEFPHLYAGMVMTLSIKLHSSFGSGRVRFHVNAGGIDIPFDDITQSSGIASVTFQLPEVMDRFFAGIRVMGPHTATLEVMKLEPGKVSTLPNDPPMAARRRSVLADCQKFQVVYNHGEFPTAIVFTGANPTTVALAFETPELLRITPVAVGNFSFDVRILGTVWNFTQNNLEGVFSSGSNRIAMTFGGYAQGTFPANSLIGVPLNKTGQLVLDANV